MKQTQKLMEIVLIGGGHAHVYILKHLKKIKNRNFKIKLISATNKQHYSGMASSYIEGLYLEDDIYFDLPNLCNNSKIDFIESLVSKIDPINKIVYLEKGNKISFDILSLDIGSQTAFSNLIEGNDNAITIKPLKNLEIIKKRIESFEKKDIDIIVAGGGAAGIEISFALNELMIKNKKSSNITIINSKNKILHNYNLNLISKVSKVLAQSGINTKLHQRIIEINENKVETNKGESLNFDYLIMTTGTEASPIIHHSGFKTDKQGYLLVNNNLQSINYPFVFGAGDCISFENYKYVKKVGVYAIKEAPILWNNILNYLNNKELKEYKPQKEFLAIISLGNKFGILQFRKLILWGNMVWILKNYIDNRFIRRFGK